MIRKLGFLAVCLPLTIAPALQAAVIANGSFETPLVPVGFYTNYPAGSNLGGWTVVGIDSAIVNGTFTQSGITFQAQSGAQWIDLAGVNSNSMTSGVTQNVATVAGQAYTLSFFVGSATDNQFFFPATIDLSINGGARSSYTNLTAPSNMLNWQNFTATFVATSPSTSITFFNGGAANNFNSALDNVTISDAQVGVPEPTSLAMWGIVALGLGLVRSRGRNRAD